MSDRISRAALVVPLLLIVCAVGTPGTASAASTPFCSNSSGPPSNGPVVGQHMYVGGCFDFVENDNVNVTIVQQGAKGTATVPGQGTTTPSVYYDAKAVGNDVLRIRAEDSRGDDTPCTYFVRIYTAPASGVGKHKTYPCGQSGSPLGVEPAPGGGATGGGGNTGGGNSTPKPAPEPTKPPAKAKGKTARVSRGRAPVVIACPASFFATSCRGTITFFTGKPAGIAAKKPTSLGKATFKVKRGKSKKVKVKLKRSARKKLARRGKLKVYEVIRMKSATGKPQASVKKITLKKPR